MMPSNLQSAFLYLTAPLSLLESAIARQVVIKEWSLAADHPYVPIDEIKLTAVQRAEQSSRSHAREQPLMHETKPVKIAGRIQAIIATTRPCLLSAWGLRLPKHPS